jgi:hypothetical protein
LIHQLKVDSWITREIVLLLPCHWGFAGNVVAEGEHIRYSASIMTSRSTKISLSIGLVAIFLVVGTIWIFVAPSGMFSALQNLEKKFIEPPNEGWNEQEWKESATFLVDQIVQLQTSFDNLNSQASQGSLDYDKMNELEALINQVKVLKALAEKSVGAKGLK